MIPVWVVAWLVLHPAWFEIGLAMSTFALGWFAVDLLRLFRRAERCTRPKL